MSEIPPLERGRVEETFAEWKPPLDDGAALAEAARCLYCADAPCTAACPTEIDVPEFIRKIGTGNRRGATRTILEANLLGYSCARVCPVEVLCAGSCVYHHLGREPIAIGKLQRYAMEDILHAEGLAGVLPRAKPATGLHVALVGAGPASLTAGALLAQEGHRATIYEKRAVAGGLNTWGIAPYKMQAEDAVREAGWLLELGVELCLGVEIVADGGDGRTRIAAASLLERHDAVFLGLGLGGDRRLGVAGENGDGVVGGTAFIERLKLDPTLDLTGVGRAVVVGGGNTALDAARELAQLGVAHVTLAYRRDRAAMKGYAHELEAARKDGVFFMENRTPVELIREGESLVGVRMAATEGGDPLPGREEVWPVDLVVVAIGQERSMDLATAFDGVALDDRGCVAVDPDTLRTANPKVWSGGDCVNDGKEVVNAVAHAKAAVTNMLAALA